MPRNYNDYLSVDSDFIPVFSAYQDSKYPNKWKSFFPHDSFKSIVSQLIETLEMNSTEKNCSVWISGSYGTGKTYASFVIKHMLEDELNSIKPYFEANNMTSLYARLSGIRSVEKGNTLVVHRSSSAGIIGTNRLNNCIRESVKTALREKGYDYLGQKSQYDIILSTLKDPQSSFNFANAFIKYKSKLHMYASPESVIRDLEELDLDGQLDLLDTIVEIAEKENYVWESSTIELINWIEDVIKGNNIYAIVFIWDEFTEFFKNNQNNITGLQEIAMAAARLKFYFFLITHSVFSQLIYDEKARKIIQERFKCLPIEMADTTAFKLLGQAIKRNPDVPQGEWQNIIFDLWQKVGKTVRDTLIRYSSDNITESELQALLPLHPIAAHLLKVISKDISSNQRTMFQFLSGDYKSGEEVKNNFRWFIDNFFYEQNGWNYLTANYIWDYFFVGENADIDETFKSVITHYNNFKSICQNDVNKENVLKVALLLTALQSKSGANRGRGLSSLLRPTLSNIAACFIGTPIQSSISNIMADFVFKSVFGKVEEDNDTLYVTTHGNIDEERFNNMKEEIQKTLPFEKLLSDSTYDVYSRFLPTKESAKQRFIIIPITPFYDKTSIERAIQCKPSNIPMFFIFAKNEAEQVKIRSIIQKLYADYTEYLQDFVIVDFSGQIFTDSLYDKFIYSKTEERYYNSNPNQRNQSDLAKRNAKSIVDEWVNKLDTTSLDVYTSADNISKCQGGANLRAKMDEITAALFNCGLEQVALHDNLFKPTNFKETVAQMGMFVMSIPHNYASLNQISVKLTNEGIWTDSNYYKNKPSHIISQMKMRIENIMNDGFEKNNKTYISDIWQALEQKPYGFQNNLGSIFLMGFLLKEYAAGTYYKDDGNSNAKLLDHATLSDLIFAVLKDMPKSKNQYIIKQTPEHIEFCKITGKIFKIATDKQNSIGDIVKNIRIFLKNNDYPLWALKNYITKTYNDVDAIEIYCKAIDLFCELVSFNHISGRDETRIAEQVYRLYKENAGLPAELTEIIIPQNMKIGMQYYIKKYNPRFTDITTKISVIPDEYIILLNEKLSADSSYLWEIGDTNHQIDLLYDDYVFIDAANEILIEKKNTLEKISESINTKLQLIKVPYTLISIRQPELNNIFETLFAIRDNTNYSKIDAAKIILDNAVKFNDFFTNQFSLFTSIATEKLKQSLSGEEVEFLFNNINSGVLSGESDVFIQSLSASLEKFRKSKKTNKLFELWNKITHSENPADWSDKNNIPILCLFQNDKNIEIVKKTFEIINKTRTELYESEIDESIKFISSGNLDKLSDHVLCNVEFKKYFAGEYDFLIDDVDELKRTIKDMYSNVYDWIIRKSSIEDVIRKLAEKRYEDFYKVKVKEKIKQLSPEKAQKFLEELIEDKPLVGINILQS